MDYYNQPNEDTPIDQDAVSILFIIWYKNVMIDNKINHAQI